MPTVCSGCVLVLQLYLLDTLFQGEEYKDQQYACSLLCLNAWGFSYAQLYLLNTLVRRGYHNGQHYVYSTLLFFICRPVVYGLYDMQTLEAMHGDAACMLLRHACHFTETGREVRFQAIEPLPPAELPLVS